MKQHFLLAACTVSILLSAEAYGQSGVITGSINPSQWGGFENAVVVLKSCGSTIQVAYTNRHGEFSFIRLPFGDYEVEASHPSAYETPAQCVAITAAQAHLSVMFTLEKKPFQLPESERVICIYQVREALAKKSGQTFVENEIIICPIRDLTWVQPVNGNVFTAEQIESRYRR